MSDGILVRTCHALDDFYRCVDIQKEVWGEADLEVEPATAFVVAAHTGGQVLGAFDGDQLVGYTLAVAGVQDGTPYLHSHMTGVLADYRDRGVGRALKLFQRKEALSRGIRRIAWTFDPLEIRNAHFNLNRLGAIVREYLPNFYGVTTSPLHRGLATDRLQAEWYLDSPRVEFAISDRPQPQNEATVAIELPSELHAWKSEGSEKVGAVQSRIRTEFLNFFSKGYAAVAVRKQENGTAYVLAPWRES